MGSFLGVQHTTSSNLSGKQKEQKNIKIITFLKTRTMSDVSETIELLRDYYPTNQTFDFNEFEDAFSILLGEYTEEFFLNLENTHSLEGQVDLYETLATVVLLVNDDYDLKLKFIFELFDFNRNGVIDK